MRLSIVGLVLLAVSCCTMTNAAATPGKRCKPFSLSEATIPSLQKALDKGVITSRQILDYYNERIKRFDGTYHAISEINPDAYTIADQLDAERKQKKIRGPLHGIPILIKDNIATGDSMETTAGSLALFKNGCKPTRDSTIAEKLRSAGAIIMGKACLSEWANFRTLNGSNAPYGDPDGWSGRCGQTANAYNISESPSGSSAGSAVAVGADFVTASLGSDTDSSIIAPASRNALVGVRPTLGLVSRDMVIPIAHSFDTVGPMARTVEDAAILLEAIAGFDKRDGPTNAPSTENYTVPKYTSFLKKDGLRGARIGVPRHVYFDNFHRPEEKPVIEAAIAKLKELGAIIVDPADIPTADEMADTKPHGNGFELTSLLFEFKQDVTKYLGQLPQECPMKNLEDLIKFNNENAEKEMPFFKQEMFELAQNTTDLNDPAYQDSIKNVRELSTKKGIDAVMDEHKLDALIEPVDLKLLPPQPWAMAGYPIITVPVGYDSVGVPFGLGFYGRPLSEPTLFKFAYAYEQATKVRKPPVLKPSA
ncbi:uncharacterized protein VTP21DRAFT_7447 [Calcarisporiella thermophila]|uniref:uncharacterized protein n=1 Tax=Calcarisporiella thermophila TaxID=911321 RepID=UPI00374270DC